MDAFDMGRPGVDTLGAFGPDRDHRGRALVQIELRNEDGEGFTLIPGGYPDCLKTSWSFWLLRRLTGLPVQGIPLRVAQGSRIGVQCYFVFDEVLT
jgi:hypothetical protein